MTGPVEPSSEAQAPASASEDRSDVVVPFRRPQPPAFVEERVALLERIDVPDDGDPYRLMESTVDGRPLTPAEAALLAQVTPADLRESARRQLAVLAVFDDRLAAWAVLERLVLPTMERDGVSFTTAVAFVPAADRGELAAALTVLVDENGYLRPPLLPEGA